ncbi:hypothetical protein BDW22DRAFT_1333982, partial [Trametopsis cervina]
DNEVFNNHVSMVRIRSEHAIGFLKGWFQLMKGLRVLIRDEASHKFATYWVAACINLHAFAIQCEDEEREDNEDTGPDNDEFIAAGLDFNHSSKSEGGGASRSTSQHTQSAGRLPATKARRQEVKAALFCAKERRRARHRAEYS